MGFFDTLLGNDAADAANKAAADTFAKQQAAVTGIQGAGSQYATSLQNLADTNRVNTSGAWAPYQTAGTSALNQLMSGNNAGTAGYASARAAYDPLAALGDQYGKSTSLYQDSLGVNGAAGNQNAVNAFQAGPGYDFTLGQGLDAINRRRAASGMMNSGNADIDALKYGTGLANQTYGDWQNKLAGFVNPQLQAVGGAASGRAGVDAAGAQSAINSLTNVAGLGINATNQQTAQQIADASRYVGTVGTGLQGQLGAQTAAYNGQMQSAGTVGQGMVAGAQAQSSALNNLLQAGASLGGAALSGGFGGLTGAAGSAVPGAFGATSLGGANGPTPVNGGSFFGRLFS